MLINIPLILPPYKESNFREILRHTILLLFSLLSNSAKNVSNRASNYGIASRIPNHSILGTRRKLSGHVTKHLNPANHLIYRSLVRNDSFGRKSFIIQFVPLIVTNDKPSTPRYKRGGLSANHFILQDLH